MCPFRRGRLVWMRPDGDAKRAGQLGREVPRRHAYVARENARSYSPAMHPRSVETCRSLLFGQHHAPTPVSP